MVAASSAATMPCLPSIATCACDPATSWRHSRLSKGIDAFIARMTAEGPSANRPPHIALEELCLRPLIPLLPIALTAALTIGGCDRQSPPAEQANRSVPGNAAAPATPKAGEIDRSHKGEAMPTTAFTDMDDKSHSMAEFRGKPVLMNLWATWCAPCVAEMPALDRLQSELGGRDFAVVAVSTDREGIKKSAPFYRRAGIKSLTLYNDTRQNLLDAFQGKSLPMTVLLDRDGRMVGRIEGAAQWDSAEAKALIAHYLKGHAS